MVEGVGLAHERRFEHQVGFDAEVEFLQVRYCSVPRFRGEAFVHMEPKHLVIVSLQANGDGELRIDGGGPCEFLFRHLFASALNDELFPEFSAVP